MQRAARAKNPERAKAYGKAYYERHPEKAKEKTRVFTATNPTYRRAWIRERPDRRRAHEATRRNRREKVGDAGIQSAYDNRMDLLPCAQCGAPGPSEVDHIIPLRWVDSMPEAAVLLAEPWCYQPLCRSCNAAKGSRGIWCFVPTGDLGL